MMDFFMHLEYHEVVAPNFRRYGEALHRTRRSSGASAPARAA